MFLIGLKDKRQDGAFSIINEDSEKVLIFFEQRDDADRYLSMLEGDDYPPMEVYEYDDDLVLRTVQATGHNYTIIGPYDLIVPPKMFD